jgi:hypothetical protein
MVVMDDLTRRMADLGAPDPSGWARSEINENIPQQARFLFLRSIWPELIDIYTSEAQVRRIPAAARLLDTGASFDDLTTALRAVAYFAAVGVIVRVDDGFDSDAPDDAPGWDLVEVAGNEYTDRQIRALHEDLLSLDPSGREGADFLRE